MRKRKISILDKAVILVTILMASGCTSMIVKPLLDPVELSLQNQTDLELIKDGAPSLLLLLDGFIAKDPHNKNLLMAATKAYGAYAITLHESNEVDRAITVSQKAKTYGMTLLSLLPHLENIHAKKLTNVDQALDRISKDYAGYLFWGAYGWASWIRFQEGAPGAMAELPFIEHLMLRVVELDGSYYYGGAHIFLGAYYSSRPQMYGGKPQLGREHFEQALSISNRKFLLAQVTYAETYARMVFDKKLYQDLLNEVLEQPLEHNEMASSNTLAQVMAQKLLDATDEYF
ncbi:MAG: hypothetical protein IME97_09710 [Proteobacteria bacterium]|nr:hypothetical protein [Pseudomonadota bacterium]